jgi:DNA primase
MTASAPRTRPRSLPQVVGRKVRREYFVGPAQVEPRRGDHWAPCPFHQEKTASFHVDDRKGFYLLLRLPGQGRRVFKFVQETENMSFMEAVELLAREAGMTDARARSAGAGAARPAGRLAEVMEQALRHLPAAAADRRAAPARDYLAGRG